MVLSSQSARQVDGIVARTQAEARIPSLVTGVVRDGVVVHVSAAGDSSGPTRDTQYRIGSITKSLTAALVLLLRDEGRLTLDDDLAEHLPDTALAGVRLRQLLCHSAGLQREPDGEWWERATGVGLDDLVRGAGADKLAFDPYRRFHYSNLAFGLLGGVVERVTGQPWWDVLQARLLAPLGMTRTTYDPVQPYAAGYVRHPWHGTLREEPRTDTRSMAPAGQLWSTVDDLARWAAVLAGAADSPLSMESLAQMVAPAVMSDPDGWTAGYGLGVQTWRRGERVFVGHFGSMPGYLAALVAHRPTGTATVAYANVYNVPDGGLGRFALSIMEAVLDGEPAPAPAPWRPAVTPPADIDDLCGRWWWMGYELEVSWDAEAGELILAEPGGGDPERFVRGGQDRWYGRTGPDAGELLQVRRDVTGSAVALDVATFVWTRSPDSSR